MQIAGSCYVTYDQTATYIILLVLFTFLYCLILNCGSVSVWTWLQAGSLRVEFLAGARGFYLLTYVQTSSEVLATSYIVGMHGSSLGGEAAKAWS